MSDRGWDEFKEVTTAVLRNHDKTRCQANQASPLPARSQLEPVKPPPWNSLIPHQRLPLNRLNAGQALSENFTHHKTTHAISDGFIKQIHGLDKNGTKYA